MHILPFPGAGGKVSARSGDKPVLRLVQPEAEFQPQPGGVMAQLVAQGWGPGVPLIVTAETQRVEQAVCSALSCPNCPRTCLEYHSLTNGARYRLFAVCPDCGHEREV